MQAIYDGFFMPQNNETVTIIMILTPCLKAKLRYGLNWTQLFDVDEHGHIPRSSPCRLSSLLFLRHAEGELVTIFFQLVLGKVNEVQKSIYGNVHIRTDSIWHSISRGRSL